MQIAFVCLGNICRLPMAEAVMAAELKAAGVEHVEVDSFGTAGYHVGDLPDPRTVAVCREHRVPVKHRGQQLKRGDLDRFDYLLCMDHANLRNVERLGRGSARVALFGEWAVPGGGFGEEVEDPYYGGAEGFETVFRQVTAFSREWIRRELGVEREA